MNSRTILALILLATLAVAAQDGIADTSMQCKTQDDCGNGEMCCHWKGACTVPGECNKNRRMLLQVCWSFYPCCVLSSATHR